MIRRSGHVLLGFLLLVGSAVAQGDGASVAPEATEADHAAVVENALSAYILPAYATLDQATDNLVSAVTEFCETQDQVSRDSLDEAFAAAVQGWAGVDFLRFGPMAQNGRHERFAFFPDVRDTRERQLRRMLTDEDPALLQPGALARQSAAVQGLPALEWLLYSSSKALPEGFVPEPYRCALAHAIALNAATIADEAVAGWSREGSWAELLRHPGSSNPVYLTHKETLTEILKAILTGLEQLRLAPAVGATFEEAQARRAPYYSSGNALLYIAASADAIRRLAEGSGILGLAPESQRSIAANATAEFGRLSRALAAAGPDLDFALADPERRARLARVPIVLASLRNIFEYGLPAAAGIGTGFNSFDGD